MSFPLSFAGPLGSQWGCRWHFLEELGGGGKHRLLKGPRGMGGDWGGGGEWGSTLQGGPALPGPHRDQHQSHPREHLEPRAPPTPTAVSLPQCAGEEDWVDSRTVYVGHREPPPGAEAYIPQRHPDNRIVSSKVSICPGLPHVAPWALRTP